MSPKMLLPLMLGLLLAVSVRGETVGPPAALTVPASDPDGSYSVAWAPSATSGAQYLLEEATGPGFSNSQIVYTGKGTRANLKGRLAGSTYHYRVKATVTGEEDSAWTLAANGCAVPHRVQVKPAKGGTITPNGLVEVPVGTTQTIVITPEVGYHVASVAVDGAELGEVASVTVPDALLPSPKNRHTIKVKFALNSYQVTATAGEGGSITPVGNKTYRYGKKATYTIKPDKWLHINSVLVNGEPQGGLPASGPYKLILVITGETAIEATFTFGGGGIPSSTMTDWITVGDLNNDSFPDIAAVNRIIDGPPPHPGLVTIFFQDSTQPGTFFPAVTYPVGNDPIFIGTKDLNGDRLVDLVVANSSSDDVSVLINDTSSLGYFHPEVRYQTGVHPVSVDTGDFNGDDLDDLAVANHNPTDVSILTQNSLFPGSFLSASSLPTGDGAAGVAAGDLNGDGYSDLVIADANAGKVKVLLQNPAVPGTFPLKTEYDAGLQPKYVIIGDLNNDNLSDLVVANMGSKADGATSSVSVHLQDESNRGKFLPAINHKTGFRSYTVAIGDLNQDGKPDLAVTNAGTLNNTGSVSILFQNPSTPGTFLTATNLKGKEQPLSVAIADINDDGCLDLIVADSGVMIRFQDADKPGTFLPATLLLK